MSEPNDFDQRILDIVRTATRPPTLARIARVTGLSDVQLGESLTRLRHACQITTVAVGESIGYLPAGDSPPKEPDQIVTVTVGINQAGDTADWTVADRAEKNLEDISLQGIYSEGARSQTWTMSRRNYLALFEILRFLTAGE